MAKDWKVPFNPDTGSMYEWYKYHNYYATDRTPKVEWRDREPFIAELELQGSQRGQSAARFWWEDTTSGAKYPMFVTGMVALVMDAEINKGVVSGTWIATKKGQNYGIQFVPEVV